MAAGNDKWTIEELDSSNWITRKFQMKHLLHGKGLRKVVNGTETIPDENDVEQFEKYALKVERALATIVLGISTSKLYLITTCTAPDKARKALTAHFERDSLSNKQFLKKQYFRKKMIKGTSAEDYLKQMRELTDKLAAIGAPIEEDQVVTLLESWPAIQRT